jgi:hypothetical protein
MHLVGIVNRPDEGVLGPLFLAAQQNGKRKQSRTDTPDRH